MWHAQSHAVPSTCDMQAGGLLQIELLTILVKLEELPSAQAAEVYRLLLDDSRAVRHAVAELVASVQEAQGQSFLQSQPVRTACTGAEIVPASGGSLSPRQKRSQFQAPVTGPATHALPAGDAGGAS